MSVQKEAKYKYSPETVEQCYEILDKLLKPEDIAEIKAMSHDQVFTMHFGLGMWMRNNFGLWTNKESKLVKSFNDEKIRAYIKDK